MDTARFSDHLRSQQSNYARQIAMKDLLCRECPNENMKILEIGSWAGQSTLSLAETLMAHNNGHGKILCVDAWEPLYKPEREILQDTVDMLADMNKAAEDALIMPLFLENVERYGDMISWIKGKSCDVLPTLQDDYFDFIYIDGSHYYDDVIHDINLSKKLVKSGGIICGDDLDKQLRTMSSLDVDYVKTHKNLDFIPISGSRCHPGVALAVHEAFGVVGAFHGFWYVVQR